jgi:RimJ/RimL family protein N-acetyltransferase
MLQDDRVSLRPLHANDAEAVARLLNNKKIWDNLRDFVPHPYSVEHAVAFIEFAKQHDPQMIFAIDFEGEFCGVISLVAQPDVYRRTAEIGYWIGEPFWNKGIATKAVKLITDYGLHQLDLIRIHTGIYEYNTASMKVLEKCGYKKDGVFEKAIIKNGNIVNEHRYSIIK